MVFALTICLPKLFMSSFDFVDGRTTRGNHRSAKDGTGAYREARFT
jgi:hypothetical protein